MDSFALWRVGRVGLFWFRCEVVQTFACPSRGMVCNTPAMVHGDQPSRRVAYKILVTIGQGWLKLMYLMLKQMDFIWITSVLISCIFVLIGQLRVLCFKMLHVLSLTTPSLVILPSRVFHQAPFGFKTAVSPYVGRVLREIRYLEFHDDDVVMCLCRTFRITRTQFNRHGQIMTNCR